MPGATGFVLRSIAYRYLFNALGKGSVIGSHVTIRSPGRICIGQQVMIDDYAVLDAKVRPPGSSWAIRFCWGATPF